MSLEDDKHTLATKAEKKPISKEEEYKLFQFIDVLSKLFPVGVGNLDLITVMEFYHENRDELLERLIKRKNTPSFVDDYWKYARG